MKIKNILIATALSAATLLSGCNATQTNNEKDNSETNSKTSIAETSNTSTSAEQSSTSPSGGDNIHYNDDEWGFAKMFWGFYEETKAGNYEKALKDYTDYDNYFKSHEEVNISEDGYKAVCKEVVDNIGLGEDICSECKEAEKITVEPTGEYSFSTEVTCKCGKEKHRVDIRYGINKKTDTEPAKISMFSTTIMPLYVILPKDTAKFEINGKTFTSEKFGHTETKWNFNNNNQYEGYEIIAYVLNNVKYKYTLSYKITMNDETVI